MQFSTGVRYSRDLEMENVMYEIYSLRLGYDLYTFITFKQVYLNFYVFLVQYAEV